LLSIAQAEGFAVYFLGSRPDVLATAVERLRVQYPGLVVAGQHHGYFDASETEAVCAEVNTSNADMLFVAMSSPKKEYWVEEAGPLLDVPLIVGIGGSLDVVAGKVSRAPSWMQRAGLEWFYRFLQEPRRMWRRYTVTNLRFVALVVAGLWRRMLGRVLRGSGRRAR
jgi:N-acetylglucosaminyldiphosphoundecaprenol N-acetyl-beta-D-mannosaminyltransferase